MSGCMRCGRRLLYSARARGSGLCGVCTRRDRRLVYFVGLAFGLALGLACLVPACSGVAHASALTLVDRMELAQPAFRSRKEEPVDARALAEAIGKTPNLTPDWAALMLTVAVHESGLAKRIAENRCLNWECDSRQVKGAIEWRAAGLWQQHRNKLNELTWGSTDLEVQAADAARMLRAAFYRCNPKGALRPDWVVATLSAYAGQSCDRRWAGLEARLATWQRLRRRL